MRAWSDRIAGRTAFDRSAADAAISRAYRACELAAPDHILWVQGPDAAGRAIRFIENPPRRLRRAGAIVIAVGSIIWVALALAVHKGAFATHPPEALLISSTILGVFGIVLGGVQPMPRLSDQLPALCRSRQFLLAGMIFIALVGYSYTLLRLGGLPARPLPRP